MGFVHEGVASLLSRQSQRAPRWMRESAAGRFVAEVSRRRLYGTGRHFTAAVTAWMAPNRGHTMYDTWLDYALSTNRRGAAAVERLAAHKPVAGARALDVGCAYAGFSVAFAQAGGSAVGIDLDTNLLELAAKNVRDKRASVELARIDVTDARQMRELGRFDFITCCDVIEHVADVPTTLANMAEALAPGGLLHLQIPNARAASLVLADGHFKAFAITLLPREDALRYFAEKRFGAAYHVGTYLRLDEYLTMLARHGVVPKGDEPQNAPVDPEPALARAEDLLVEIQHALVRSLADPDVSSETGTALETAVRGYLGEVRAAQEQVREASGTARDAAARAFAREFAIECWDVIAFKRA